MTLACVVRLAVDASMIPATLAEAFLLGASPTKTVQSSADVSKSMNYEHQKLSKAVGYGSYHHPKDF